MEGNLLFKIVWASLIVGRKFTINFLLCFTLYLRAISEYQPTGGAYIWRGLFSEFYVISKPMHPALFSVKEHGLISWKSA